tara:strand:+ start:450 stop:764 length:315 start_codon:yes stop_codon:yes gene_type:complete
MDLGQYKGMEEEGFWFEMQELAMALTDLVEKYNLEDKVISSFVVGLLEPFDDETSNMKAFFHYNIQSQGELDIIQDFMTDSYTPPEDAGPDLDDLLDGLGISLN